jgi:hypothetical protein
MVLAARQDQLGLHDGLAQLHCQCSCAEQEASILHIAYGICEQHT